MRPVDIDDVNTFSPTQCRNLEISLLDAVKVHDLLAVGSNSLSITHTCKVSIIARYLTTFLTQFISEQRCLLHLDEISIEKLVVLPHVSNVGYQSGTIEGSNMDNLVLAVPRGRISVDGYHLKSLQLSICSLIDLQFLRIKFVQNEDLVQCLTSREHDICLGRLEAGVYIHHHFGWVVDRLTLQVQKYK